MTLPKNIQMKPMETRVPDQLVRAMYLQKYSLAANKKSSKFHKIGWILNQFLQTFVIAEKLHTILSLLLWINKTQIY